MNAVVLPFHRPVAVQKADGVFAAVSNAAMRMGYTADEARSQAIFWRDVYRKGTKSPAGVIADATSHLRRRARKVLA